MPITPLPPAPQRQDEPDLITQKADAMFSALPNFVTEANALEANVNAKELSATQAAQTATTKAEEALVSANLADARADAALASEQAAAAHVASIPDGMINDTITSNVDVWSSSKVSNELGLKQEVLVSGTNIKTVGGVSVLGSGDIAIISGVKNNSVALSSNYSLPSTSNRSVVIVSATGNHKITLPDATTVESSGGVVFYFSNQTSYKITLCDNSDNIIGYLDSLQNTTLFCIDTSSTRGKWATSQLSPFSAVQVYSTTATYAQSILHKLYDNIFCLIRYGTSNYITVDTFAELNGSMNLISTKQIEPVSYTLSADMKCVTYFEDSSWIDIFVPITNTSGYPLDYRIRFSKNLANTSYPMLQANNVIELLAKQNQSVVLTALNSTQTIFVWVANNAIKAVLYDYSFGMGSVLTISDTTIGSSTYSLSACVVDADKILVAYKGNVDGYSKALIITNANRVLSSTGSKYSIGSQVINDVKVIRVSTNKVLMYERANSGDLQKFFTLTVSGTAISSSGGVDGAQVATLTNALIELNGYFYIVYIEQSAFKLTIAKVNVDSASPVFSILASLPHIYNNHKVVVVNNKIVASGSRGTYEAFLSITLLGEF